LRLPRDGRRRFEGSIAGVEGEGVLMDVEGKRLRFAFAEIDKARLVPEL
jgi:ribosome maturation factor RimP